MQTWCILDAETGTLYAHLMQTMHTLSRQNAHLMQTPLPESPTSALRCRPSRWPEGRRQASCKIEALNNFIAHRRQFKLSQQKQWLSGRPQAGTGTLQWRYITVTGNLNRHGTLDVINDNGSAAKVSQYRSLISILCLEFLLQIRCKFYYDSESLIFVFLVVQL